MCFKNALPAGLESDSDFGRGQMHLFHQRSILFSLLTGTYKTSVGFLILLIDLRHLCQTVAESRLGGVCSIAKRLVLRSAAAAQRHSIADFVSLAFGINKFYPAANP